MRILSKTKTGETEKEEERERKRQKCRTFGSLRDLLCGASRGDAARMRRI